MFQERMNNQDSAPSPCLELSSGSEYLLADLARHDLLDSFVKARAEAIFVSNYKLNAGDGARLSDDLALRCLQEEFSLTTPDQFAAWRQSRGLTSEESLLSYAHYNCKRNDVINELLSKGGETLFLRYKDRLDRVLYSLIRVESEDLAYSLYYSIEAGDLEFGAAASAHSVGPESKTQGLIGPVDLTTPHPEIAARLRTAEPRYLFAPFSADQWHVMIRLEYRFDSEYDENTKRFLGGLLLSARSHEIAKELRASLLSELA